MKALSIFKALADSSRLSIVNALQQQPHCVEDLATRLQLSASTISAHLKKLQQAGLVYAVRQQYYSVYHLNKEILTMSIQQILPPLDFAQDERLEKWRQKVINTFFDNGRLIKMPVQNKKRWVVYQQIIKLFEPGKKYPEKELNELIETVFEDYCLIRRELVEEGVLARDNGIYELIDNWQNNPGFYQKVWQESNSAKK